MTVGFLLDFDNTLSDNDLARAKLTAATQRILGAEASREFWTTYEQVRDEMGFVDFLGTLERYDARHPETAAALDRAVLDFPYEEVLYPDTLRTIDALWQVGVPVVLSDGDRTYQPLKISRSGVDAAVRGNVLVFPHKERDLDDVARLFPADRYVAVDDKAAILALIKLHWAGRVATVHVLQGINDPDVPRQHAVELVARFARDDVVLTMVKDGDHRLSRPEDIERLIAAVAEL